MALMTRWRSKQNFFRYLLLETYWHECTTPKRLYKADDANTVATCAEACRLRDVLHAISDGEALWVNDPARTQGGDDAVELPLFSGAFTFAAREGGTHLCERVVDVFL